MDNDTSIHNVNFNLINEYFVALERQGPGSPEATIKALSFIGNLSGDSKIADLGCGTGGQTWKGFLKEGGFLAVTYKSWFTEECPRQNTHNPRILLFFISHS
jgi:hypothetical protein